LEGGDHGFPEKLNTIEYRRESSAPLAMQIRSLEESRRKATLSLGC